ncbi:hypothetical protein Tco_0326934 [Tanacetum coccineum]
MGSTRAFVTRYIDGYFANFWLQEDQRISSFVHGLRTRSLLEFHSTDLPNTYKVLMEKMYTWIEAKEVATNCAPSDNTEGSDRELRYQIEEAVKFVWLAHLVKGIKKWKAKTFDTQMGEWKKGDKDVAAIEP